MPDLTPEYSPEKGWLTRQFENVKRDVAEWPEWMRRESGRMKTDLTTAEMREKYLDLRAECDEAMKCTYGGLIIMCDDLDVILNLALEALARREREEERDKRCATCGHRRARHFGKYCSNGGKLIANRCKCTGFTDSPVTDGEAG